MTKTCSPFLVWTLVLTASMLCAHPASAAPAASPRRVAVGDLASVATHEQRKDLKYLASCALGPDTVLVAEVEGQVHEFPGGMGLAPDWWRKALTPEEERWVSACILARTNYYGVPVQISLRSPFPSQAPGMQVEDEEARSFDMEEGTFFGNIFGHEPAAYVCGPGHDADRQARMRAQQRICALPLSQRQPDGRQVTACRFIYVGPCTESNFTQDGVGYHEAVTVSLRAEP